MARRRTSTGNVRLGDASAEPGRVVVASSDPERRKELAHFLELEGHRVCEAPGAAQALREASSGIHDLILIDASIEGVPAHSLCRAIRPGRAGIIVLGSSVLSSAVDALNAGADDFLALPFSLAELGAHIRAILRRISPRRTVQRTQLGDRVVDFEARRIRGPGNEVSRLAPKEFVVLQALLSSPNQLRTHEDLAQTVWRRVGKGELQRIRTIVNRLRRKLEADPRRPLYILTERSVGYRFQPPPAKKPL